jgi:hypothetical protein
LGTSAWVKWKDSQYSRQPGRNLDHAGVLLEEFRAVEVAAAVEKDLPGASGAVDQVSAEFVGGEQARAGWQGGDLGIRLDGKLVGRKTRGRLDGGSPQQGETREQHHGHQGQA